MRAEALAEERWAEVKSKEVSVKLLCPEILLFENIVPWGGEIIEFAENKATWEQSSQVRAYGDQNFKSNFRSSESQIISTKVDKAWEKFELGLYNALNSAVVYYKQHYNSFLEVKRDSGYELLKYQTGQKFDLHVDSVSGREEVSRQLSGLVYLNEDYTGGGLKFPRQGIEVQPKAGDIILFPSNFCYPHTALPILTGIKYAVVTWFF